MEVSGVEPEFPPVPCGSQVGRIPLHPQSVNFKAVHLYNLFVAKHKIIIGDSYRLDYSDIRADVIFTDVPYINTLTSGSIGKSKDKTPPYQSTDVFWISQVYKPIFEIADKVNAEIVASFSNHITEKALYLASLSTNYYYKFTGAWCKIASLGDWLRYNLEYIPIFVRKNTKLKGYSKGFYPSAYIEYGYNINKENLCDNRIPAKPVPVVRHFIEIFKNAFSDRGSITVLDIFAGTLSTLRACDELGINSISIEINRQLITNILPKIQGTIKGDIEIVDLGLL